MTPRLDILNRMPGVRIQPVSAGGGGGPVVARKSAPPTFQEDFYSEKEDSDNFQINSYAGGAEFNELRRVRKAHSEKIFATVDQKKILMEHYHVNNYPSTEDMARMTELTGLDERFLKQWFQYTRKHMKSKGKVPVRIEPPPPDHVGYVVPGALRPEKDFVSFQYDPTDAVETKIERDGFTHEEAIEKAMQYDDLKRKFDELHKNFLVMSNALLKKGYKGDSESDSTQRSTPINQEVTATGKDEFQDNNGDKTLNGPFRPPADGTSTPVVARVKQEKEVGESAKKEPVDIDDKDDPSKNINIPPFPQEANSNQSYAPPYHPGPYPPHPMYPPYQPPYNPNLPPHMQPPPPPPNWPPYQQPPAWNPNYPPYGSAGYPPSSYPPPGQAPAGYPPTQPYAPPHSVTNYQQPPPPSSFPGQTPPPSNPFHSTPPPPHVAGQTPPPPHPAYPPHPYHMQSAQYPTPPDPTHPYSSYNPPHEPTENLQMKTEEPQVKTESVSPQPPPTVEMAI